MLVEEYRPDTIDRVIGQDHIKPRLENYIEKGEIPNMLFAGDPGLGKTTCAQALVKELYGDRWTDYWLELNASDERGIDVVRERIKEFAKAGFDENDRIIFLDEADALTNDAQSALRRTMERHSNMTRFILSCNYSGKIIPAIQSRCALFRFQPVPDDQMTEHLKYIAHHEEMQVTLGAIEDIVRYARGDVRKAVMALDTLYIGEELTSEEVVKMLPIADVDDVLKLLNLCSVGKYNTAIDFCEELLFEKGVTARNIIREISEIVWDTSIDDRNKVMILQLVGETEYRINEGGTEHVQMAALLATIVQETRNQ